MSGFSIVAIMLQWIAPYIQRIAILQIVQLFDNNHNVKIQWVASGHYGSKTKLQGDLQNTFSSHSDLNTSQTSDPSHFSTFCIFFCKSPPNAIVIAKTNGNHNP